MLDRRWVHAVVSHLQPVFDADGSGWSFHGVADPPVSLLWEASPTAFVARHPEARIEESYGCPAEEIPCLDFWFYLEPDAIHLSWEGYPLRESPLVPTGDGDTDGRALATRLAHHLRLSVPPDSSG